MFFENTPPSNALKIKEENHYYPFGLKHSNYNGEYLEFRAAQQSGLTLLPPSFEEPVEFYPKFPYNYKYNGKEWQDELGLNVIGMDWRQYDPAIGRFVTVDPEAEESEQIDMSPYSFAFNNPVMFNDPDGRNPIKDFFKKIVKVFGKSAGRKAAVNAAKKDLLSSKKSYLKLIKEHKQKIKEFNADPIGNSSKEALETMTKDNPSYEVLLKRAKGRATALEKQLKKQEGELAKINKALKQNSSTTSKIVAGGTAGATSNNSTRELAGKSVSIGATLTDTVENAGTNIFGNNEFGRFLNEINPLNIGLSDIFKSADETLNTNKKP